MKSELWLDTNVIIYFLVQNDQYGPQASQLVQGAVTGKYILKVSPLVIAECVFVLMGRGIRKTKDEVKLVLTSFINLPGIECEEKTVIEEALRDYSRTGIDFTDAYIAAHARHNSRVPHVITVNIRDFLQLDVQVQTPEVYMLSQTQTKTENSGEE